MNLYSFGLGTLLTIIFMVLKLVEVIAWSWWIVFLPLGLEVGFFVLLFTFIGVGVVSKNRQFNRMINKKG